MGAIQQDFRSRFPPFERTLRLTTGLILFSFATTHFLNHACGILRLGPMEAIRLVLLWPWRTYVGQTLLYGSFVVHGSLGLYAFYRRRHFRIPAREKLQLFLGLSIPLLVIIHATNVRLGHTLFDLDVSYPRTLYRYWVLSPKVGLTRQFFLLIVLWTHGCIGLHSWLRTKPWYVARLPFFAALATLIPVLAVIGMADAGRDLDLHIAETPGFLSAINTQTKQQSAELSLIADRLILGYLALLAAVWLLRSVRDWRERRFRAVTIRYPRGEEAVVPRGFSILEASRWAGLAHLSICGGRGRCSTCRVLVTSGLEYLPSPNWAESNTLSWIGAYRGVRLACQVRPRQDVEVIPLLSAETYDPLHSPAPFVTSEEHEIAAFFVDLRNSTLLADGRLPYDALYIIDRYVAAVARVAEANGGQVTSIAGDGVMCFFGADCDPRTAARRAIVALRDLWRALSALDQEIEAAFDFPLRFGAGCHLGLAVVGQLASRHMTQFLGEVGNIAARLEGLTKELGCPVIISRAALDRAGYPTAVLERRQIPIKQVQIRNVTEPVEVVAFRALADLEALIPAFETLRRSARSAKGMER